MRTILLFLLAGSFAISARAQAPTITGDTMLCPNDFGTASITTDVAYDSYQWYWRYWFGSDPFVPISGADGPSFTYDWLNYDQAQLKVVVTLNGETYESNVIQIDSYAWVGLTVGFEDSENISINPENGNVMLCAGTGFTIQTYMPYTEVQWYRNGVAIDGATSMELHVTEAGSYHVVAAPGFCPNSVSSNEGLPIVVEIDNTCNLGTNDPSAAFLTFYPNPVADQFVFSASQPIDAVTLFDVTGKKVMVVRPGAVSGTADLSSLASGVYVLEAKSGERISRYKIVKK